MTLPEQHWTLGWLFTSTNEPKVPDRPDGFIAGLSPYAASGSGDGPLLARVAIIARKRLGMRVHGRALHVLRSVDASRPCREFALWALEQAVLCWPTAKRHGAALYALEQLRKDLAGEPADLCDASLQILVSSEPEAAPLLAAQAALSCAAWRAPASVACEAAASIWEAQRAGHENPLGVPCASQDDVLDALSAEFNRRMAGLLAEERVA